MAKLKHDCCAESHVEHVESKDQKEKNCECIVCEEEYNVIVERDKML
jgi:hypothetical protein